VPTSFAPQQQQTGIRNNMYDEIYLRGYGDDNDDSQQQEPIEGWAFCAEPRKEPTTIILFGEEDHWDEQFEECPVCHVSLGKKHESWCSYQDGE
jgi:hypothetical protein